MVESCVRTPAYSVTEECGGYRVAHVKELTIA